MDDPRGAYAKDGKFGGPFRGLPGGILPEFPCLWSRTTVAWSVPAFLPRKPAVGTQLLSAMVALGPPDLSQYFLFGASCIVMANLARRDVSHWCPSMCAFEATTVGFPLWLPQQCCTVFRLSCGYTRCKMF